MAPAAEAAAGRPVLPIAAVIGVLTLAIRLPFIGELPIFNDEAMHMRWSQLIAGHPSWLFEIPLADPRPPVYPGLVALPISAGIDPLLAGRLVSAAVGALTVVFAALLLEELAGRRAALAGAVLVAVCPFLSFHQRLATIDSLFVLECVVAVWLALRFPRDGIWPLAVTMAVTMGTRLVLCNALWPLLFACVPRSAWRRFAAAVLLALVLWSPYLLAYPSWYGDGFLAELRRRILFHPSAGGGEIASAAIARNVREIGEWVRVYLTPPVAAAALIAPFVIGWRRRSTALLLLWFGLLTLPLIVFGSTVYSRYFLAGAMPLVLLVACGLQTLRPRTAAAVVLLLSLWPVHDVWLQLTRWREQRLTLEDRSQYVTGRMAGEATEKAIAWLRERAKDGPMAIVTGREWGVPADAVWLAFHRDPDVHLRFLIDSVHYDTKWSPRSAPSPLDPALPTYGIFRRRRTAGIPRIGQVEFAAYDQRVVVQRLR